MANPVYSIPTENTAQKQTDYSQMKAVEYPTAIKNEYKNPSKDANEIPLRHASEGSVIKLKNIPPWGELELDESENSAKTGTYINILLFHEEI
jgi:hypothetical protein